MKPTQAEIDELLDAVSEEINKGSSRFHGMSYEEGIRDTIEWMTGETDEHPYED